MTTAVVTRRPERTADVRRFGVSFAAALTIVLGWGALSFGAVYPWGWVSLVAGLAAIAAWATFARALAGVGWPDRSIAAGLVLFQAAILIQLVPLSPATLVRVSPATDSFLRVYNVQYAPLGGAHSLSISPGDSWWGAVTVAILIVAFLACARAFSYGGTRAAASAIVLLGALLALVGIIQKPLYAGRIYGFWFERPGNPFGPFVNRNHFAGWMIMGLSVSLGYFCGRVARGMRGANSDFRSRALWFTSPDASRTLLTGMAILVMGLALVMTLSRSGIACFALALAITGIVVIHGERGSRRIVAAAYLVLLLVIATAWAGVDAVAARFSEPGWNEFSGRAILWRDSWQIALRFMPFGTGFNTYGAASLFFQTFDRSVHVAEAHNDYLQLLAEGGLLLTIPAALAIAAFVIAVRRRFAERADDTLTRWTRVGAVTALTAIALQEVVDFSLQIPGVAALFVVVAAIAVHRPLRIPR